VAALVVLGLAGCGSSSKPSGDDEVRSRIERFIAGDIRHRAIRAGIGGTLTVHSVRCVEVDPTRFTCRIRTSSDYGDRDADSIADVIYDVNTRRILYDIRPTRAS
jgi:hypothetical protein